MTTTILFAVLGVLVVALAVIAVRAQIALDRLERKYDALSRCLGKTAALFNKHPRTP